MLPEDVRLQKSEAEEATRTLDGDLRERPSKRVIPYSDKRFHRAAVEWLAATDQVSHFFLTTNFPDLLAFFAANPSPRTSKVQGHD